MRDVHKVSFPLVPQLVKPFIAWRLHVRDSVMTSHDECNSGTTRVAKLASLQRLAMEALNSAPADVEV